MSNAFAIFERIARSAYCFSENDRLETGQQHPFDVRSIHPRLPSKVRDLFDDGHYAEATFEAFKFVDRTIDSHAKLNESGFKLMMAALSEDSPLVKLTSGLTTSEKDEQKGFRFLFAGGALAIRNPRAHDYNIQDDPDICLDYLAFASLLLRRVEAAGYSLPN